VGVRIVDIVVFVVFVVAVIEGKEVLLGHLEHRSGSDRCHSLTHVTEPWSKGGETR